DDVMDAASASNPSNYTVSNGLTVNSVIFTPPSTVTLAVTPNMIDQTQYTVTFNSNIQDCVGNPIVTNTINFTYYDIVAATTGDLIFNEIFADPTPSNGLPEAEYVEIFNRSNKTVDLENYRFEDGQVHTLPRLILPANSYAILCTASQDTAFLTYTPNVIGISGIGLTNGGETIKLRNASGLILDSLRYDDAWYQDNSKDDGGWSLELKNPDHACKGESNWSASIATIGGTPGIINSIYDNTPDTDLPSITGAQQINANQVRLTFSEVMDIAAMTTVGNYSISNGLSFLSATAQGNNSVILTVDNSFTNNTTYIISANNASDCVGNSTNLSIDFTYYDTESAGHYDIIINEIFPDSDPQIGLPEKEYIELYNRSDKVINLQGYTISDGSSAVGTLPFFILQPNSYVILHKDDGVYEYAPYGDYVTSTVFPDLNISGDDLVLRSAANTVIDAVSYDPDWFQNGDKDNGGWSLERINPNRPCEGSSNWRASEDNLGGTPGRVNSILQTEADTDAPDVIRAYPFANNQVRLFFSEAMGDFTAIDASNYDLDNNRVVISASLEAPFYNTVLINIDTDLEAGIIYTLNMSTGLTDCVGNAIGVNKTVQFALPEDIQVGDVILNEILFNPVTGGSDFIELYNNSNKVVNIADIILANTDDNGLVNQTDNVETDWLLFPQQYVVLSEDPNQVKETYATENPNNFVENDLPTYADNEGSVIIYNIIDSIIGTDTIPSDQILDQFDYLDDYHTPLIDDDNGVSLERIDFNAPTQDEDNWHSAATAVGYATPAYQNSSFQDNVITDEDLIQIPDKTFSPDGDGFEDFLLINYNVEDIGYVANVTIYDANGRPIRTLVNGELLMREGTFQWDGADDAGNKAKVGVYVILLEIFNPAGDVQRMKKTCVVAGAF
ncbi:MAG: lamin tail domain-containing protein, partial [Saprospiraceae bacterium]|nr:lamin tail domain-containing protein [Saprospiraceae bacterium]